MYAPIPTRGWARCPHARVLNPRVCTTSWESKSLKLLVLLLSRVAPGLSSSASWLTSTSMSSRGGMQTCRRVFALILLLISSGSSSSCAARRCLTARYRHTPRRGTSSCVMRFPRGVAASCLLRESKPVSPELLERGATYFSSLPAGVPSRCFTEPKRPQRSQHNVQGSVSSCQSAAKHCKINPLML